MGPASCQSGISLVVGGRSSSAVLVAEPLSVFMRDMFLGDC